MTASRRKLEPVVASGYFGPCYVCERDIEGASVEFYVEHVGFAARRYHCAFCAAKMLIERPATKALEQG